MRFLILKLILHKLNFDTDTLYFNFLLKTRSEVGRLGLSGLKVGDRPWQVVDGQVRAFIFSCLLPVVLRGFRTTWPAL